MPVMPDKPRLQMPAARDPFGRRGVEGILQDGWFSSPVPGLRQRMTEMVPEGRGRQNVDALTGGSLGVGLLDFVPGVGEALAGEDFRVAREAGDPFGMGLAAVGALPLVPSLAGLRAASKAPEGVRLFHGSGKRDIEKFDLDFAGSGSGGALRGHGIYGTVDQPYATGYRDIARRRNVGTFDAQGAAEELLGRRLRPVEEALIEPLIWDQLDAGKVARANIGDAADEFLQEMAAVASRNPGQQYEEIPYGLIYELLSRQDDALRGAVYELDLKVKPDEVLRYDYPMTGQPRQVRESIVRAILDRDPDARWGTDGWERPGTPWDGRYLRQVIEEDADGDAASSLIWPKNVYLGTTAPAFTGEDAYDMLGGFASPLWRNPKAQSWGRGAGGVGGGYFAGQREATAILRDFGVPSATYRETHPSYPIDNYVVYDPDRIDILRQYGILPPAMLATMAARDASSERSETTRRGAPRKAQASR